MACNGPSCGGASSSEEQRPTDLVRYAARAEGEFAAAGYDHVYVHQVGPDQEGFIRFYEREIIPELTKAAKRKTAA